MYEVIAFRIADKVITEYRGNDWVQALVAFGRVADQRIHSILWEGQEPIREFHPELGYSMAGIETECS
jgi:hypothetical protein